MIVIHENSATLRDMNCAAIALLPPRLIVKQHYRAIQ
jgi:hypothetical protein